MEGRKVIICLVVGFLGLLSACMAFASEAKRIKPSQIQYFSDTGGLNCIYPSNALRLGLALGAAAAIVLAQIIVSAATGCFCIGRGSYRPNSIWGILGPICFILSWVAFCSGLCLLILGAVVTGRNHIDRFQVDGIVFISLQNSDSAKTTGDNPEAAGGTAAAAPPNQGGVAMKFPSTEYLQPLD